MAKEDAGGNDDAPGVGELVAVSAGLAGDEVMGTEEGELAAYLSGGLGREALTDISVGEAIEKERARGDGGEQGAVVGTDGAERTVGAAAIDDASLERVEDGSSGGRKIGDSEGIEIARIGRLGETHALGEISKAFPHGQPAGPPIGALFALNQEALRVIDGGLDAKDGASFVVHLDGVLVDLVFDPPWDPSMIKQDALKNLGLGTVAAADATEGECPPEK